MIQDKWNFISPTNIDLKGVKASTIERFANYPASTIKDEILSRLVNDIGIQGRTFQTLTKACSLQCSNLIKLTTQIIVNFEKLNLNRSEFIVNFEKLNLYNSEFVSYSTKSELTMSKILKECDLIRRGYKDISLNLNRISDDFQTHKSYLEKEKYVLEQEVSNIQYRSKYEKLSLISMIATGGILGWYYGRKLSLNLSQEKILKENEIIRLKKSTDYIENVMNDVKFFDDKVGLFEIFWARQIDHISVTQQFISNANKGNVEVNDFNMQSLLASWIHAKTTLVNYQANVKAVVP
ncbi:3713_t:CDS:2 [Scutellospora calospora]|uniref:3713_t:CDS:1 n=1 Tax=Scutellospora calospora TaxID=85575 RepID=A0ACA9M126_9GLOM|nr:3713_t:CDS:2 [Scutellospora calospora]